MVKIDLQQAVSDAKSKPVPLANMLSTEDGMRRVIQALSDHIDDLETRVQALEGNKKVVQ